MRAIRDLLKKDPELLKLNAVDADIIKKRQRYERIIEDNFDKLEDIAKEAQSLIMTLQHWRLEAGEKIFEFGKAITAEYDLNIADIDRLFSEVLPKYSRGPLLGFLISGIYHEIIQETDVLFFDLSKHVGAVSGFGFKHPRGKIEMLGNRAFFLGVKMSGGEVELRGHAGSHIGKYLQGGKIAIKGNARNWIGHHMHGGSITIEGNAGDIIGKSMTGGEITVKGNAGGWVGDDMRKGVIRVKGECGPIDESDVRGEIFRWVAGQWKRI